MKYEDLPEKLRKWHQQPYSVLDPECVKFVEQVHEFARRGVGYGFMQQVIEWIWQEETEKRYGTNGAWGPEFFAAQIRELETKLAGKS